MGKRTTLSQHGTDDNDVLWMQRNNVEVLLNDNHDDTYTAILHQRKPDRNMGGLAYQPWDVVTGKNTAQDAIQEICDRNNILSPWDIRKIKQQLKLLDV